MRDETLESTQYNGVFFDLLTEAMVVFTPDGSTMIEVYGKDRVEHAVAIATLYYPEGPSDVKTIY